ncbi:hypothetical protein EIP86_001079 [Pleurotus ostreatoroseus]|nr:hypothetical protein EIP86_001079 [Pleurotus ostreatoroseus]
MLSGFFSLLLAGAASAAIGPITDLRITDGLVNADGFPRQAVLVDGQHPGPLIKGSKGDFFSINVVNRLTNSTMRKSTSIHWHGLLQHGDNWADGAVGVNQCPVAPGNSFDYRFQDPGQAGTYWYHSHLSTQYCDGLRGPFVIYDPLDPFRHLYDVDDESTVITLADWYHTAAPLQQGFTPADATLINGLGRYKDGPSDAPLSVISVRKGKRYRFRLVSLACDPNYNFSIDGHDMTVIEADGVNHQPVSADSIRIFAGQRYSFILEANQPVGNYWIRASPDPTQQTKLVGFDNAINSAILRYVGAPENEPTTEQTPSIKPLQEVDLHPLVNPRAPGKPKAGGADKTIPLALSFNFTDFRFLINNASFTPPTMPVLLQILSGAKKAQELMPKGSVIGLPKNSVIELIIPPGNAVGGPHPFHLHGHTFSVVRSAGSKVYNYDNPPRRDVVSIGTDPDDAVTIRFTTDNPGPWFLHCHIDPHLEAGLAVVMAEDIPETKFYNPVPLEWRKLCPTYNALPASDQ